MILHIIPDSVFTDFVIEKFDYIDSGNHIFLINVVNNKSDNLTYTKNNKIEKIDSKKILTKDFLESLNEYSAVVIHSIFSKAIKKMIMKIPLNIKLVWLGWGGDYYETIPELERNLYEKSTLKLINNTLSFKEKIKKLIKFLIPYDDIKTADIYNRVDYFGPVIYDEYTLLESVLKPAHSKYIPFSYGQLENDLIKGIENIEIQGDNILLGNSASATNNHLDIMELLSKFDLGERKVITPLSYGNNKYAKVIISFGNKILKDNFLAQTQFMKKDQYHKLISSCSICIMNHKRQQSLGNIISMLYLGSKLFLNKENLVYKFLKQEGAIVFSIEELNNNNLFIKLNNNEIEINRNVLKKHWSEKAVNKKYMSFIDILKIKGYERVLK